MVAWYLALTSLEKIFFWIGVVGSIALIVQIVLLLISFGGGDLDADGDFDMDGDVDTDGGLGIFTLKGLTAFFALGGWCGFAAATYIPNVWAPILIALATGTVALIGVGFAMRAIAKLQCSGNLVPEKLAGKRATVYVSVPASRTGRGKITLTAQGKFMEIDAVTDGDRLAVDEEVEILSYTEDFAVVKRAEKESGEVRSEA